jgi:hypothetical protein
MQTEKEIQALRHCVCRAPYRAPLNKKHRYRVQRNAGAATARPEALSSLAK